jgi:hypothetical protein
MKRRKSKNMMGNRGEVEHGPKLLDCGIPWAQEPTQRGFPGGRRRGQCPEGSMHCFSKGNKHQEPEPLETISKGLLWATHN